MKCPWECGWEGPPEEYAKHYDECPNKICPECGSTQIFFYKKDHLQCLVCGNKWKKGEIPKLKEAPPKKEKITKTFKTEEEFRAWLTEENLTAEPRPGTGIFKNGDRVASYFETEKGIEVDLIDTDTWLYRDGAFLKVETEEGVSLEAPLELPEEAPVEEATEEVETEEAGEEETVEEAGQEVRE